MFKKMPNTTTGEVVSALQDMKAEVDQTSGRVLTLIVLVGPDDDLDHITSITVDATYEHPARVILLTRSDADDDVLDAEISVGGSAGEYVRLFLSKEMAEHCASVVTPLLLPDTPIVAWWPSEAPKDVAEHPIGKIAQRRITDIFVESREGALYDRQHNYIPGDSDLMWSRITPWRAIVASCLEYEPHEEVRSVEITGPDYSPAVDIGAAWLASRLGVPTVRKTNHKPRTELGPFGDTFSISHLKFVRDTASIEVTVQDSQTVRLSMDGRPDALMAMNRRGRADCLAEELRHLEPDVAYADALRALDLVTYE